MNLFGLNLPEMSPHERCIRAAAMAGCPEDQVRNFMESGITFQPKQWAAAAAARECDVPCDHDPDVPCHPGCGPTKIGYGGARGGGKTFWGIAQIVADDCARFPGLKFLYLRRLAKAGREAINDLRRTVLAGVKHTFHAQTSTIVLDNGSRVVLGHFQHERDIDAYLGLEYDGVLIEEATQLTWGKVQDILTCVRTSKEGWRPRVYMTTNPGGVGHGWFKRMFIDPNRNGTERETRFVKATIADNRRINREYKKSLKSLTGWKRRAWLNGDWDIQAGQYFTTWSHVDHVVDLEMIPEHWRVWIGFDYGYTHYTVATLFTETGDGDVYAVDCHADRGCLPERHVQGIKAMLGRWGVPDYRLEAFVAGHDVFSKDHRGSTIADNYSELGIPLEKADIDRVNGWAEMLRRLGDPSAEPPIAPTFFVNRSCQRLIESIPALEHDPRKPEDVLKVDCDDDGNGGDDFVDSARYGLMYASNGNRAGLVPDPFADYRG